MSFEERKDVRLWGRGEGIGKDVGLKKSIGIYYKNLEEYVHINRNLPKQTAHV